MASDTTQLIPLADPEHGDRKSSIKGKKSSSVVGNAPLFAEEKSRDISRDLFCFVLGADKYGSFKTKEVCRVQTMTEKAEVN